MPKSAEIKQQALEKGSEEPRVYEQQVHMSDTEPLLPRNCTLTQSSLAAG